VAEPVKNDTGNVVNRPGNGTIMLAVVSIRLEDLDV
jgi:hypothetical protein